MLTLDEKKILARYLIGDWDFDGSEESESLLEYAIDKAREAYANDRPIRWIKTPSNEAAAILDYVL